MIVPFYSVLVRPYLECGSVLGCHGRKNTEVLQESGEGKWSWSRVWSTLESDKKQLRELVGLSLEKRRLGDNLITLYMPERRL